MNKIKFLLCFALLMSGVEGRGQIYINSYAFGAANLLLDDYPNAAAAYSLRLLDKDYTGNCIMVRKTGGGNDSTNIAFSGGYLDTVALKNFCGTTSTDTCWVRTWYDQSGNARDIRQTNNAFQPRILQQGAIIYQGNRPTVNFDGTNDGLLMPQSAINAIAVLNQSFSIFAPLRRNTINTLDVILRTRRTTAEAPIYSFALLDGAARISFFVRNDVITSQTTSSTDSITTAFTLVSMTYNGTTTSYFKNNTASGTGTINFASGTLTADIGAIGCGYYPNESTVEFPFDGRITEIIIYASDQGTNRSAINTNKNTFYSIY